MSKHTPGPWRIGGFDKVTNLNEIWTSHDEPRCPFLIARTGQELENSIPMDEANANARLIASAPELLEALKWAVGLLHDDWDGTSTEEKIKEVENLITKAEA